MRHIIFFQPRGDSDRQVSAGRALRHQSGFSLVEILTVIAIIGLLAAIAIPQFTAYRREAVDAEIKSDLRNAAMAMESYYAANLAYPSSVAEIIAVGFQSTQGVTLSVSNVTIHSYLLTATKPGGSQASFIFDSTTGAIH